MRHIAAIVLKGYPRLSETFIAQELLSLQRIGLDYSIVSLRHPTDKRTHPIHKEINADVNYLPGWVPRSEENGPCDKKNYQTALSRLKSTFRACLMACLQLMALLISG